MTGASERQLRKNVIVPLRSMCVYAHSSWLLHQLGKDDRLPSFNAANVPDEERAGCRGLSYGMIARMTSREYVPWVAPVRASRHAFAAAQQRPNRPSTMPSSNTLPRRIRLLFDWNDAYPRRWDTAAIYRRWPKHCHAAFSRVAGCPIADKWRSESGQCQYLLLSPSGHESLLSPGVLLLYGHASPLSPGYCSRMDMYLSFHQGYCPFNDERCCRPCSGCTLTKRPPVYPDLQHGPNQLPFHWPGHAMVAFFAPCRFARFFCLPRGASQGDGEDNRKSGGRDEPRATAYAPSPPCVPLATARPCVPPATAPPAPATPPPPPPPPPPAGRQHNHQWPQHG